MELVKWAFVSNYINHHQIPFCNAMYEKLGGSFVFIQTMEMEAERVAMGWQEENKLPYLLYAYKEPKRCQEIIDSCQVLLYGGLEDESYIQNRLKKGDLIIRYSERLYREGQWKAVSPRGLLKKYKDHTRYRNSNVYLLCSGAYVASDFDIVKAYPGKKFCWGYFPELISYDLDKLLEQKGYETKEGKVPYILWAGRFLTLKHPELAVETARFLQEKGCKFHMEIIGDGERRLDLEERIRRYALEDSVTLTGFLKPNQVREKMEKANIYLFTSDRNEGWGAVVNESMNSGCAVVANHMIGSVPYLIRHGINGYCYPDKHPEELYKRVLELLQNPKLCESIGREAYETISREWNPENAASKLLDLARSIQAKEFLPVRGKTNPGQILTPCSPAPVISERGMYGFLTDKTVGEK